MNIKHKKAVSIESAETLDKSFYLSPQLYEDSKEKVFWNSWHFIGNTIELFTPEINAYPIDLFPGFLDESLLLINDEHNISCMSNVCTHRGFQMIHHPAKLRRIICGYHGRRFSLSGQMEHMPEFKEAENFPRPCDHLSHYRLFNWRNFLFVSDQPSFEWEEVCKIMEDRIGFLPIEQFRFSKLHSKEYMVHAHWALYVENYLEGFHIPFVHHSLNDLIDYGSYETIVYDHCNLQVAYSANDADFCFDLPEGHVDYGKKVTAYYYWVFPNTMFNFYPWGVQINTVMPLGQERCKVLFLNYIFDMDVWERNNYGHLSEKVEREDEFVVESVQRGLKSRKYQHGRYSPRRESGVYQFHRLIETFMSTDHPSDL